MRYLSVFSGIEAATVAWRPLGWELMAVSEIDGFACSLLSERYLDVPNLGDMTEIDWGDFIGKHGRPDLLVGGSPCQSFSQAGRKDGLKGASGLMFEYVRAVQELRPRWVVWENVVSSLTIEHGDAFGQLLSCLGDCGYGLAWRVLDAQLVRVPVWDSDGAIAGWVGPVPQGRRRVFVVGCLGDGEAAPEVLFEPDSMSGNRGSSKEEREAIAKASGRGSDGVCGQMRWAGTIRTRQGVSGGGKGPLLYDEVAGTLATVNDQALFIRDEGQPDSVTISDGTEWVVRKLTPTEWERLMGFPDGYTEISGYPDSLGKIRPLTDNPRRRALGNSMCVNVMRWIGERIEWYERRHDGRRPEVEAKGLGCQRATAQL